jgi:hypothetical protein
MRQQYPPIHGHNGGRLFVYKGLNFPEPCKNRLDYGLHRWGRAGEGRVLGPIGVENGNGTTPQNGFHTRRPGLLTSQQFQEIGGTGGNRTHIYGFAVRCITTLPPRPGVGPGVT